MNNRQFESPEAEALTSAMHEATAAFQPPTAALVRGGIARGKKFQSLRRMQVAGAALAVVAAAGVGTIVVAGGGGTGSDEKASVAAQPPAVSQSAAPEAAKTGTLTARQAFDTLKKLLPQGYQLKEVSLRDPETKPWGERGAQVEALVDSGDGKLVQLHLYLSPEAQKNTCWQIPGTPADIFCKNESAPQGELRLEQNREYGASEDTPQNRADDKAGPAGKGAKVWTADLNRKDGNRIFIQATNAAGEKTGVELRKDPALTVDQLKAIVTSPEWNALLTPTAFPPATSPDTPKTRPSGADTGVPNKAPSPSTTTIVGG